MHFPINIHKFIICLITYLSNMRALISFKILKGINQRCTLILNISLESVSDKVDVLINIDVGYYFFKLIFINLPFWSSFYSCYCCCHFHCKVVLLHQSDQSYWYQHRFSTKSKIVKIFLFERGIKFKVLNLY